MRRKDVTRRLTSIAEVRPSVRAHRDRIGRAIEERPASGEGAYSQAYFDHMDAELATVEGNLITAEDAHVRKQIEINQARRRSDALVAKVYDKQTSARQILIGLYGSEHQFDLAATAGKTPAGPMTLPQQVDQTVKLLRNPVGETPSKRVDGVNVEFTTLADDLESGMGRYQTSRVELDLRRKEADATRIATNRAIEEYDRVFPWVAGSLEGMFRLAGERNLADRIRTSVRRVTRCQEVGQQEETEAGESASEEPQVGDSAAVEPPSASSEPAEVAPPPAGS